MNECDIAETCTGDSSQVRPSRLPCGPPSEAATISLPTPPLSAAGVATADQAVSHLRYEFFMPPGFALPIIRPVFIVWLDAWCVLGISVDNNII